MSNTRPPQGETMAANNKRLIPILIGGGVAVVVGIALAVGLSRGHKDDPKMNDMPTGLTFNVSDSVSAMDTKKPLRCYVNGAYVGDLTLAECAQKNGVAAQKLDVGVDDSGNLAAAPTASLVPVPQAPTSANTNLAPNQPAQGPAPTDEVVPQTQPEAGPTATCLRYNSNSWNQVADNVTLGQCVVLLFNQRCVPLGQAAYGRWGDKTLRLVPRRVEQSDDNVNFRSLVDQAPNCAVPMVR